MIYSQQWQVKMKTLPILQEYCKLHTCNQQYAVELRQPASSRQSITTKNEVIGGGGGGGGQGEKKTALYIENWLVTKLGVGKAFLRMQKLLVLLLTAIILGSCSLSAIWLISWNAFKRARSELFSCKTTVIHLLPVSSWVAKATHQPS